MPPVGWVWFGMGLSVWFGGVRVRGKCFNLKDCGNSGANTCDKLRTYVSSAFIRSKPNGFGCSFGDSE